MLTLFKQLLCIHKYNEASDHTYNILGKENVSQGTVKLLIQFCSKCSNIKITPHIEFMSKNLKIGTIVKLKASFLGEPIGTEAVIYEEYGMNGISLITVNGVDLGGFALDEYDYLEYLRQSHFNYSFQNVTRLADDFRKGIFKHCFDK